MFNISQPSGHKPSLYNTERYNNTLQRYTATTLLLLLLLSLLGSIATASTDDSIYRCGSSATEQPQKQPLWISRCYDGKVTLENFDSIHSIEARLKSNLFWGVTQKVAGFQKETASGQLMSAEQSLALLFFLMEGGHLGWAHDVATLTKDIRQTGPVIQGIGFDTHQRVQIYYSDGVVKWLKSDRKGKIPDGEIIIKQMYASDPTDHRYGADRTTGWAVMVRNSKLSQDGWIWYLFFFPKSPPYNAPVPVSYGQTGDNFCLSCHAAADNDQLTFAAISNLEGAPQQYTWVDHTFPGLFTQKTNNSTTPQPSQVAGKSFAHASGSAQFQQLGVSGQPLLGALTQADASSFMGHFKQSLEQLSSMSDAEKELFLATLLDKTGAEKQLEESQAHLPGGNQRILVLLDKLLAEFKQAVKEKQYGAFLNDFMQTYLRLLTQQQSVTPLSKPNPDILTAYQQTSNVTLPKNEAELNWFPLDFIFTHTPALPKELPASTCKAHQNINSTDNPEATTDCRDTYITSDNCNGCHWSYVLQGQKLPNMVTPDVADKTTDPSKQKLWDISPYAEWSASMMGLAGRDPIFNVQLEWERHNQPQVADQISNLCTRCHQAAGQRQYHLDHGDPADPAQILPADTTDKGPLFSADYALLEPSSEINNETQWGALGRDGITCTLCHQIEAEGLGTPGTFTGQFHFPEQPGQVYGPYEDQTIKPYLMEQAIGIKPVHGAQMKSSALCGSCHTVITPILTEPPVKGHYRASYEQTTYPEWLNSEFSAEGGESCQECHMPSRLPDDSSGKAASLSEIIANVETAFLPPLDNRAADGLITPDIKPDYRRHTLVGMNLFANQMFQQFPDTLGNSAKNAGGMPTAQPPLLLAEKEMSYFAKNSTVKMALSEVTTASSDDYQIDLTVENLVGHKFPSGVGFRRAFVEFNALNSSGKVLWSSGSTNSIGQIVDSTTGTVLNSEMTTDPLKIPTGDTIIDQTDEVYLFEERTATWKEHEQRDPGEENPPLGQMVLTTSFLEIVAEAKDTRLLPKGWKADGPYAEHTSLSTIDRAQKTTKPFNPAIPGVRTLHYRIPKAVGKVAKVEAIMRYQSIPPYYIRDRLQFDTEAAQRFYFMVANLKTKGTAIEDWSVELVREVLVLQ